MLINTVIGILFLTLLMESTSEFLSSGKTELRCPQLITPKFPSTLDGTSSHHLFPIKAYIILGRATSFTKTTKKARSSTSPRHTVTSTMLPPLPHPPPRLFSFLPVSVKPPLCPCSMHSSSRTMSLTLLSSL